MYSLVVTIASIFSCGRHWLAFAGAGQRQHPGQRGRAIATLGSHQRQAGDHKLPPETGETNAILANPICIVLAAQPRPQLSRHVVCCTYVVEQA